MMAVLLRGASTEMQFYGEESTQQSGDLTATVKRGSADQPLSVSVTAPSTNAAVTVSMQPNAVQLPAASPIDLRVVVSSPDPFQPYSFTKTVSGTAVGIIISGPGNSTEYANFAANTVTVSLPYSSSCSTCIPTCVTWTNGDWRASAVDVTTGTLASGRLACTVLSSGIFSATAVQAAPTPSSSTGAQPVKSSTATKESETVKLDPIVYVGASLGVVGLLFAAIVIYKICKRSVKIVPQVGASVDVGVKTTVEVR
jgi:hypothetical protein